jgi:ArsR family transcriptional regulator, arsenate/arsenite/antimonite-responsive transcriptional repressor
MIRLARHAGQLAALGHVARLSILRSVVQAGTEGVSTTDLQARVNIPPTTLNHHLERLVRAGLIATKRASRSVVHTPNYDALRELTEYVWEDCCKRGKPI